MKHSIYYFRYLLPAFLLVAGCNKGLDLAPKDQLSDESFWKTAEDFRLAANDFYFGLKEIPSETGYYDDDNSDIAFGNGSNSESNGSYLASPNSTTWDDSYKYIRGINYLLEKSETPDLDTAVKRYAAEALFFRAYFYFNLVRKFGGVPLISIVLDVDNPELYSPRSSRVETVDFILQDLDNAWQTLPKQSQLTSEELGRVTQGAALALKARAALFMGTWAKYHGEGDPNKYLDIAIDASEKIIASNEYALYKDDGADSYKYLFETKGDDSKEIILARRYDINSDHLLSRVLWFNAMTPTKKLADMYLAVDGLPIEESPLFQGYETFESEFENRDPRMAMTFVVPGSDLFLEAGYTPSYPGFGGSNATKTGYAIRKFMDESFDGISGHAQNDNKEYRYAETLLILAEALFERNGTISDADLERTINVIRERVNMPDLTNAHVTTNNLSMLEEIRRERTIELALEGFRREDLRRWKTAEVDLPPAVKGVKFVGTDYQDRFPDLQIGVDIQVDNNGFVVAEPASSRQFLPKQYVDPLPTKQIQLSNGTLSQNSDW